MKRIILGVVAALAWAVSATAQVELDTSKIYLWSGGSARGVIMIGSGAPSGGNTGDQYMDYTTGELYTRKASAWIKVVSFDSQSANTVLAGPTSGGSAAPTFRALVAGDIPGTLNATAFAGHVTPSATDTYDLGSATAAWRQGYISQMNAVLFAKQTQQLYGGWLSVQKNAGTFGSAVSSGATTVDFGQAMTANQFVVVKAADTGGTITSEYMKVGTLVSGTTYNVTRNLSGIGAKNWPDGTPYAVRGVAGDGWIELNAFDTPRLSLFTQGSLYNNSTETIRLGHLTGMPNSSSGIGIYMGDSTNYFRWDGSSIKFVTAGASMDSNGVTVGAGAGAYDVTGAYKFNRPAGGAYGTFGQTGDRFGVSGVASSVTTHDLAIENVMKGLASGAGGGTGVAQITLTAQGWNAGGAGSSATAATFQLSSQPSGIPGAFLDAPRVGISVDGSFPAGSAGVVTIEAPIETTSTIKERSRSVPLGEWTAVAHAGGNYTASSGTWTVDAGDQSTFAYTLIGKTMIVSFSLNDTALSAAPSTISVVIPGGFTAAREMEAPVLNFNNGVLVANTLAVVTAGSTTINFSVFNSTFSSGALYLRGQLTFEVQ